MPVTTTPAWLEAALEGGRLLRAGANGGAEHSIHVGTDTTEPHPGDVFFLLFFVFFSILVVAFLASLLFTHFPLACANVTTIEENYDNMPNPFDHGAPVRNLAQVMGLPGMDWLLPIAPWRSLSDGISYLRPFEVLPAGPAGMAPEPEERWWARYGPHVEKGAPTAVSTLLAPLSTWWAT